MFNNNTRLKIWITLLLACVFLVESVDAARIKDLANIRGVRSNQLIGFGIVIGLAGTGDSATNIFFSIQTIVSMLRKMGVTVPSAQVSNLKLKNVSTVMVTADMAAFSKQGDRMDVTVSALGDGKSLQGGTLLMTPLKGQDTTTYAVAQGPVTIGGYVVQGAARGEQKNHLNVGRIANGAIVEKELPSDFNSKPEILLSLTKTDFTTVQRVTKAINDEMKDIIASTVDGRTVRVAVPAFYANDTTTFVTKIEKLDVEPDFAAKVIIEERTGTVVMGENVRISAVAVSHGSLIIQIRETAPPPAPGQVEKPGRARIIPEKADERLLVVPKGVALGEVVNGLNTIGVTPRDLIAILQSIKAAGALQAEIEIL